MNPSDRVWREHGLRSAILAGDESAWRTWYEESFEGLAAYVAWRCAASYDLSDEVVQETWLTAVRRIRSFDPERGSFAGWLRGIAANILSNHFRRQKRRAGEMRSLNGQCQARKLATAHDEGPDWAERVAEALTTLPDRYEAVLRAKYLDQQSVAQIVNRKYPHLFWSALPSPARKTGRVSIAGPAIATWRTAISSLPCTATAVHSMLVPNRTGSSPRKIIGCKAKTLVLMSGMNCEMSRRDC
jgi:RNA polymerase sigma-70 factor (ECF subfamily)